MTDEETVKEINTIIGAFDNCTLERVKRLCNYISTYQWAVGRLDIFNELSDREIAVKKKNECLDKLRESLKEFDKKLGL